jgi:Stress responsive A/B Barrel Domain
MAVGGWKMEIKQVSRASRRLLRAEQAITMRHRIQTKLIMKIPTAILCAAILAGVTTAAVAAEKIKHVVSFKFKSSAKPEDIKRVETAFADLKKKIPQIKALEWGTNMSPEKLNKDFTHCWILTFSSVADRDAYLVHPDHKEFGKNLGPVLEDVIVIDFVAKE